MKIDRIEVVPLVVPLARTFHGSNYSMSERATLITRVYTDEGIVGEIYNGDEVHTQHEIARIITEELQPRLLGLDPLLVERCWQAMEPLTFDILRDRKLVIMAMACVDSALWDVVGKAANMPLYRLWGGYRDAMPIVAIGGYHDNSEAELVAEMEYYRDIGLAGCKTKVGGQAPELDARRFQVMQDGGGEGFVLMADANGGYSVTDAVRFVRLVGAESLRWFEEPVRWFNDVRGMRDVRYMTGVPVAAGQSEISRKGAGELMAAGAVDVCNFDASWSGGPTEWRRVAAMAAVYGVEVGHHEEPQISAHLLASTPHGTYVECFHPDRDPLFWNLIANRPEIRNGMYPVPQGPGWGIELDTDYIQHYRADR